MEEKLNTIQSLIGVLNSPIAQRKGVTISPEHCKVWVEELTKFMQESGWHPASKPPKDEEEVIAAGDYSTIRAVFHEGEYYIAEYYHNPEALNCALNGVKWWCYPPKEE
jgi:hypothetical protein